MARIRKVEIENFRGIKQLSWDPSPGVNCLIGPGDVGKSSVLDAIDFCLSARRITEFTDADFFRLDVESPVSISVTIGELDDSLKNFDVYGMHLRGFDPETKEIEDEPGADLETVLTVNLTIKDDLEPSWTLVSNRAHDQGIVRSLRWSDRNRISPARIGATSDYHLSWRRGSVLNRVSEAKADASSVLAKAARDARAAFSGEAQEQLLETLEIVATTASELGIPTGETVQAMLDTHSVSFSGGTISLHDDEGVPLRGLGTGSTRLLIAGLQRKASDQNAVVLIDELEYGLEPHRIIRLIASLGAKERTHPLQVFMTTHSPVALRELAGDQLYVVRSDGARCRVMQVGTEDDIQGTIRAYPEAFLSPSVIVCEGASEVGMIRGLDLHRGSGGAVSIGAKGVSLIDCQGGDRNRAFSRAFVFVRMGYRAAILRDADVEPDRGVYEDFVSAGGVVFSWREGLALEDELFTSLTDEAVGELLERAVNLHGTDLIDAHIKTASRDEKDLESIQAEIDSGEVSVDIRNILAKASRSKKVPWFKKVTLMEDVARDIIGPNLAFADIEFRTVLDGIFGWASDAG